MEPWTVRTTTSTAASEKPPGAIVTPRSVPIAGAFATPLPAALWSDLSSAADEHCAAPVISKAARKLRVTLFARKIEPVYRKLEDEGTAYCLHGGCFAGAVTTEDAASAIILVKLMEEHGSAAFDDVRQLETRISIV
jgi:hypothetical protein